MRTMENNRDKFRTKSNVHLKVSTDHERGMNNDNMKGREK